MNALGRVLEGTVVISFLLVIATRELLRADGSEQAQRLLRRTAVPVLLLGFIFVIVVCRRLYELAT